MRYQDGGEGILTGASEAAESTDGCGGMSTSGEPHDAEERQPADLEGNPGCQGAIADATNGDPGHGYRYEPVMVSPHEE